VKSPLQVLLARVAQATDERGKQASLASFLKVSPARVSEWVRGVKEPGGEYTLRLLEWVTAEEAQQKSLGGAENAAKGKTRLSKEHHEKSGPIKS
jgi:transcriptional regulator with XRE-family HTH domain